MFSTYIIPQKKFNNIIIILNVRYYIRLKILVNTLRLYSFLNIVNSHSRDDINSAKFYRDTDYHAGQTAREKSAASLWKQ